MNPNRREVLQTAVERYQRSLENLVAMNEQLRTLPPSERLTDILEMNEQAMSTTRRMLDVARERLQREQAGGVTVLSPQTA